MTNIEQNNINSLIANNQPNEVQNQVQSLLKLGFTPEQIVSLTQGQGTSLIHQNNNNILSGSQSILNTSQPNLSTLINSQNIQNTIPNNQPINIGLLSNPQTNIGLLPNGFPNIQSNLSQGIGLGQGLGNTLNLGIGQNLGLPQGLGLNQGNFNLLQNGLQLGQGLNMGLMPNFPQTIQPTIQNNGIEQMEAMIRYMNSIAIQNSNPSLLQNNSPTNLSNPSGFLGMTGTVEIPQKQGTSSVNTESTDPLQSKKRKLLKLAFDIASNKESDPINKIKSLLTTKPNTSKFFTQPFRNKNGKDEFKFKNKPYLLAFTYIMKDFPDEKTAVILSAFDGWLIASKPNQYTEEEWNNIRKKVGMFDLSQKDEIMAIGTEYFQLIEKIVKDFEKLRIDFPILQIFKPSIKIKIPPKDGSKDIFIQFNDTYNYIKNAFQYLIN